MRLVVLWGRRPAARQRCSGRDNAGVPTAHTCAVERSGPV